MRDEDYNPGKVFELNQKYNLQDVNFEKKSKITKICPRCNLSFSWRKKWEKNWENVKYCIKDVEDVRSLVGLEMTQTIRDLQKPVKTQKTI